MSVALVTGGTKNIGLAVCRRLAADGHEIAVNGRSQQAVDDAVATLRADSIRAEGFVADIASESEIDAMFTAIEASLGPVAILVNNAGLRCHGPLVDTSLDDWNKVLGVVLTGSFLTSRRAIPKMVEAGWGRIVNLSGLSAQLGAAGRVAVVAAKSGIMGLTKATSAEVAEHGVTVNAISPGFIDTDRSPTLGDDSVATAHYQSGRKTPVGRVGQPDDVAELCGYLCSEAAGYITGQTIGINGGSHM